MRIPRPLYDEIVAHAQADAPNECCGMVSSRDGDAVTVYRTTNTEASPFRFVIDPQRAVPDPDRDRGRRPGPRRDLPLAHAQRAVSVADRHQPRQGLAGRAVDHRRPGRRGAGGQDLRDPRRPGLRGGLESSDHGAGARADARLPACASRFSARRALLPRVQAAAGPAAPPARSPTTSRRATSAPARSSRSWPRASWSRSPGPATRPRASSSRGCCWRRGCPACCAAAPASTCPTSSPPARVT